jgi:AcrR family transcriptional regulator
MDSTTRRTGGKQAGPRSRQVISSVRQATLAELGRVGYAAMTIDAVARAAGVNRTTIYRRWPTKAALLADVVDPLLERYDTLADSGDAHEDLIAAIAMIRDAWATPEGQALHSAIGVAQDELQPLVQQVAERTLAPLLRVLERAAERGDLPADDVTMTAHLAFHGAATWQRAQGTPLTDAECRRMAAVLLGRGHSTVPPSR